MNALIALLILSLAAAGAAVLTQDQLTAIQAKGYAQASLIGSLNRNGTLQAATIQWQLATGSATLPTPEMLVNDGYLAPEFLAGATPGAPD